MENIISRPSHYSKGGVEPIDLIQSQNMGMEQANVVKYVTRYKHKNGVEDLKKALQYLIWLYTRESFKEIGVEWYVNMKLSNGMKLPELSTELFERLRQILEIEEAIQKAK